MKTFIVCTAEDVQRAAPLGGVQAYLFYRIEEGGALMQSSLHSSVRGGIMGIYNRPGFNFSGVQPTRLAAEIARECKARGYSGVLLDFEENVQSAELLSRISPILTSRGLWHFVPLRISAGCEMAKIIVPSAISGGSYDEMLRGYIARFEPGRLCLELVKICTDFVMPVFDSQGTPLTAVQLRELIERTGAESYFSNELCAKYFTYRDGGDIHFVLYDDALSAKMKIERAAALGFSSAFVLYRDFGIACSQVVLNRP